MNTMRLSLSVLLLLPALAIAGSCNVDTSPITNSPYSYDNPNTSCGGTYSMPGLPDVSFGASGDCPGNIRSIFEDSVSSIISDINEQVDSIPNSVDPQTPSAPSTADTQAFCRKNPQYCNPNTEPYRPGEDLPTPNYPTNPTIPPKEPGVIPKADFGNSRGATPYCHPSNPNHPDNASSCRYRKIKEKVSEESPRVPSEAEESNPSNYWKKRFQDKGDN